MNSTLRGSLLALLVALAGTAWAEPPPAPTPADTPGAPAEPPSRPCKPAAPGERFNVDFNDAALTDVARLLSCAAARNIMFTPATLGAKRVTVLGPRPVTLREFDRMWLAVLANHGLKRERRGSYDLILPVGSINRD